MNIFFLDVDPVVAAEMHCDKHVVKMILEHIQMLSSSHRIIDGTPTKHISANGRNITRHKHPDAFLETNLYKTTHQNHPCSVWVRESNSNYNWLYECTEKLCDMYHTATNRKHASAVKLMDILKSAPENIPSSNLTLPPSAMKDEYKLHPNPKSYTEVVQNYHNYYLKDKVRFATWGKYNNPTPDWWNNMPTYNYECESCKIAFEKVLRMSERNLPCEQPCESCGEVSIKKIIVSGAPTIQPNQMKAIDGDFRSAMKAMKKRHPNSNIPNY